MKLSGEVLVIDDELSLLHTLQRILDAAGCNVTVVSSWQQAMDLLLKHNFDLIYLDIHLPDIDGLQILGEIKKRDPGMAVVLLTGHGSMQTAVEALRLGASDYLLKPLDPEVLIARTRTILKEREFEKRRIYLKEEIAKLQTELHALDHAHIANPGLPAPYTNTQDRFLKRGHLILDLQAKTVTYGEEVISLPPTAFDYLAVLARQTPAVVEYQTLVFDAQKYQVDSSEAGELAKWHIHVLRQALEQDPQKPRFILNVRGVGYRLLVD